MPGGSAYTILSLILFWLNSGEYGVGDGCDCGDCGYCEYPVGVESSFFLVVEFDALFVGEFCYFVSVYYESVVVGVATV